MCLALGHAQEYNAMPPERVKQGPHGLESSITESNSCTPYRRGLCRMRIWLT